MAVSDEELLVYKLPAMVFTHDHAVPRLLPRRAGGVEGNSSLVAERLPLGVVGRDDGGKEEVLVLAPISDILATDDTESAIALEEHVDMAHLNSTQRFGIRESSLGDAGFDVAGDYGAACCLRHVESVDAYW